MTAISGLLQTIPLLSTLSSAQLAAMAGVCERCTFAAGEKIVAAGAAAEAAYFMMDDHTECLTTDADGQLVKTSIPSGAVLLELAMIVELDVSATCVARNPAKVLKIPRQQVHDLMQEDIALTDKVIEALTVRLKDMGETMREAGAPFEPIKRSA